MGAFEQIEADRQIRAAREKVAKAISVLRQVARGEDVKQRAAAKAADLLEGVDELLNDWPF